MHAKALLATILLSTMVVATPMPGKNKPISAAEWDALKNGGLKARRGQNVPISNDEMARLKEGGLLQRDGGLEARDSVMNCGKSFTGDTRIGGSGKWVPRTQFEQLAEEFCNAYVGSEISKNHETSDTYPTFLTNQNDPKQQGPAGNVVFAIFNTVRDPTYIIDKDTCLRGMKAPLLAYLDKGHKNGKGDHCYGSKNNDYEGGYYKIDGIGAFGSEVYKV